MKSDQGARNLIHVFLTVVGLVTAFYGYLAWRAFNWNPMFFIRDADSKQGQVMVTSNRGQSTTRSSPVRASVERGGRLYLSAGCAVCHGVKGQGQVRNPNYVKDVVPALNVLAERLFLNAPEDVDAVLKRLDSGQPLRNAADLDVPRAGAVVAQYESVRTVILSGNPAGKKDLAGPEPFDMPKWDDRLSELQVKDLIAYLLSLYPWDAASQQ